MINKIVKDAEDLELRSGDKNDEKKKKQKTCHLK